jgi:hypothetical protein
MTKSPYGPPTDPLDEEARPRWLDTADDGPPLGEPELDDIDAPILDEPPFVTMVRNMEGGPYHIAPDSGEQVPTDFYAKVSKRALRRAAEFAKDRPGEVTPEGKAVIPAEERKFLEKTGPAGQKLLETLERGLEATTPELEEAVENRLRDAGLL